MTYFLTGFVLAIVFTIVNAFILKKNLDFFGIDEDDKGEFFFGTMAVTAILTILGWVIVTPVNILIIIFLWIYKNWISPTEKFDVTKKR